jgi:hypothetical protein
MRWTRQPGESGWQADRGRGGRARPGLLGEADARSAAAGVRHQYPPEGRATPDQAQCHPDCRTLKPAERTRPRGRRPYHKAPRRESRRSHHHATQARYLKLCTSALIVSPHPSTSTNNNSLNGIEIIAGGNMNIPMDISTDATTASITMNGR